MNAIKETLFEEFTNDSNHWLKREVRLFQTDLSDEEFAESNLLVIGTGLHKSLRQLVLNHGSNWNTIQPIITRASSYKWIPVNRNVPLARRYAVSWRDELDKRIEELRSAAEEEGLLWSEDSLSNAIAFVESNGSLSRPGVFVLENGNIRFLWVADDGSQVGLQFLGNEEFQYVCFAKRQDGTIERSLGNRAIEGFDLFLKALGLDSLVLTS